MVEKLWRYVKPFSSDTGTLRTDRRTDLLYQYRASRNRTADFSEVLCEEAVFHIISIMGQIPPFDRTYRLFFCFSICSLGFGERRLSYGLWYNCSSFSFTVLQFCCRITSTDRSTQLQSPISAGRYVPFPRKFCFIYFITELSNINLDFWIISSFATNTTAFDKLGFNVSGLLGKRYGKLSGSFTTMAWLRQ